MIIYLLDGNAPDVLRDFMAGKPGTYANIRAADYHALDCCSFSRLTRLARSPLHCWHAMHNPERTPAMLLGDAAHLFVLQPQLIETRYVIAGDCAAKKGDGGYCTNQGKIYHDGNWYCGVHDPAKKGITPSGTNGRDVLTQEDCDCCSAMRDAVLSHPKAKDLIEGAGPVELSMVWVDTATGVLCKGRIDKLRQSHGGVIVDLKTTYTARRKEYERKIYGCGYHLQAGMYIDGAHTLGIEAAHFVNIPVEKKVPAAAVYRFKDDVVEAGAKEARRLMAIYADCKDRNEWPGYGTEIEDLGLPNWDWRELNGEEE